MRILLVEDDSRQARLLSQALVECDARFAFVFARTLREAVELVTVEAFDAILLDLNLPDSRSVETVLRMHEISPLPIVVLTGERGDGEQAIRAGADEYLVKGQAPARAVCRVLVYAIERRRARFEEQERTAQLEAEIARRITLEDELRRSESHLRTIVQSEPECVKSVAPDGTVLEVNRSGLAMLGVASLEDIRGRSILEFIHPEDRSSYRALHDEVTRGGRGVLQFRVVREDGTERWVESHSVPLTDDHGSVTTVLSVTRDITDRKRAEESLEQSRSLLQLAGRIGRMGAWIITLPERTVTWSDEVYTIHEESHDMQPTLDRALGYYTDEYPALINAACEECARHGTPFDLEAQLVTAQGRQLWVRVIGEPGRDAEGTIRSLRGAIQDITERTKVEQHLLRAQRVESIGRLAGGIAHDLNNLLMPILMGANLLKKTSPDANPKAISMIEQSAKRGGELVSRIMSFARGAEGKRVPLRLRDVVDEVEAIAVSTFPASIEWKCSLPDDLWLIEGDATQLHQVLLNLAVNARDAMPEGGTLSISAANASIDHAYTSSTANSAMPVGPYVRLEVSDTGVGIPIEIRERIFDPFFTTKHAGKGSGLGLSTVAAIARAHNGYVTVHSRPGRGTTFELYLPAAAATAQRQSSGPHAAAPQGRGELLLVVDDDETVLAAMVETLNAAGYRVVTARDATSALTQYAARHDELKAVITDVVMPNAGGAALIRGLAARNAGLPVIVTSGGSSEENDAIRSIHVGHYLQKPYTADVLLRTVREALEGKP